MDNQKSKKNLVTFLGVWGGRIAALIGFTTSIIGFVDLITTGTKAISLALLGIGLVLLMTCLLYIVLKKELTESIIHTTGNDGLTRRYTYSKKVRRLALVGITAILLLITIGLGTWRYIQNRPPDKIIVLVADFEGPEANSYRVTETIFEQLKEATKKYSEIEIRSLGKSITAQQGSEVARAYGKDHKASIVLWGWYGKTAQKALATIHVELLGQTHHLQLKQEKQTLNVPLAELDSFNIQVQLSSEMSYLTLLTLGLIRFETEDYEGTIARLTDALNQPVVPAEIVNPHIAYLYRGLAYSIRGDESCQYSYYDLAINDYTQALNLDPANYQSYVNRATTYMKKHRFEEASYDLNKAASLEPDNYTAYFYRGYFYTHREDYDHAITDFERAIRLAPNHDEPYVGLAIATSGKKDYDRALSSIDQGIIRASHESDYYRIRGVIYSEKEIFELAFDDFNQAININPKNALAYSSRGFVYFIRHDYDNALADYNNAINLSPECARVATTYVMRGMLYSEKKNYENALTDLNKAIQLDPMLVLAFHQRGLAYYQKGDIDYAINDYDKALMLEPNYVDALISRGEAYYLRALGYRMAKLTEELDKEFGQSKRQGTNVPPLENFNQQNQQNANVGWNIKFTTLNEDDYKRAISDFDNAISLRPTDAELYYKRGQVYTLIENKDNANADFNKALLMTNDSELRKKIDSDLQKLKE